jgi:hypothetical protein
MARRSGFKLPGFTSYVERIKNVTAKEAAEFIVEELQDDGPAWGGEFRNAWKILPGSKGHIRATQESKFTEDQRRTLNPGEAEARKEIKAPPLKGRGDNGYTIGNAMEYRDIALDLVPGRWGEGKRNTAPKDWYVTFAEGGKLKDILEAATLKAAKDPTIRGFKDKGKPQT